MGWTISVAEHDIVGGRFHIAARETTVPDEDRVAAMLRVLRWAHADAGVPGWKPWLRESLAFVTARGHVSPREERLEEMRAAQRRRDARAEGSTLRA